MQLIIMYFFTVEKEGEKSEDVVEGAESESDTMTSVVSSGRQRHGDTKSMPMFSLEIPILVEFRK